MLTVSSHPPWPPLFPAHHKANHEAGRRVLDVLAPESENKPQAVPEPLLGRQGGQAIRQLHEHGPKTWPSLALFGVRPGF